ncbi:DUF317 domain-containing protein [Streptomyces sp. NPDC056084]|uniref:DUF317 domain-containing protein n=1 Tax=unclassified Streptomyces TaxID=2593676 RepID=UPI0035E1B5D4
MSPHAADDRVMVSPRYMAGAGDRFADVLGPLIHLFGWRHDHDPATGNVTIDSPDRSVFVDFRPLHPLGRWVTVTHHEPYWKVSFSRQAPLEAVAAVTQALPQLLGDTRHSDRIPITDTPLDQLAELHDWAAGDEGVLTSPDHYCRLEHTPGEETAWQVEHLFYEHAPLATFTQDAPEVLVRQFFAYLAAPIAVERSFGDLSPSTRQTRSALITPVRPAGVDVELVHALDRILGSPGRRR